MVICAGINRNPASQATTHRTLMQHAYVKHVWCKFRCLSRVRAYPFKEASSGLPWSDRTNFAEFGRGLPSQVRIAIGEGTRAILVLADCNNPVGGRNLDTDEPIRRFGKIGLNKPPVLPLDFVSHVHGHVAMQSHFNEGHDVSGCESKRQLDRTAHMASSHQPKRGRFTRLPEHLLQS